MAKAGRPTKEEKLQRYEDVDKDPAEIGPKPRQEDGSHWTTQQDRAAQLRALDYQWNEIAEKMDAPQRTLDSYPSKYENFYDLVSWYRTHFFNQKLDQLIENLWPEALKALHTVLADYQNGGEGAPDHKEAIQAARTILKATGFQKQQRTRQELKAREEVTGSAEETHRISTDEDMDDEQLEERIAHLERTIKEEEDGDE